MECDSGRHTTTNVAGGNPGPNGATGVGSPPAGIGQPGAITSALGTPEAANAYVTPAYTGRLLHAAQTAYINDNAENATDRLVWMRGLLDAVISSEGANADGRLVGQRATTYVLLRQLSLGLDYYGAYQNTVSLLPASAFASQLKQQLNYGAAIEKLYDTYQSKTSGDNDKIAALNATQLKILESITVTESQSAAYQKDLAATNDEIANLVNELNAQLVELFDAQTSFQQAVASRSQGCSFAQTIELVGAIATLVASGGSAAAAIGAVMTAIQAGQPVSGADGSSLDSDLGSETGAVKLVVTAVNTTKSFVSAYKQVAGHLQTQNIPGTNVPGLPTDDAKIITEASALQAQLKPYLELDATKAYSALIQTFVATATARNNKVLESQMLSTQIAQASAQIESLRESAAALQTQVADIKVSEIGYPTVFMAQANRTAKNDIVRTLYQLRRAIRFHTLADPAVRVDDSTIGTLTEAFTSMKQQYQDILAQFGSSPARENHLTVDITPYISPASLKKFRTTGTLLFAIPITDPTFNGLTQVLTQSIQISLSGIHPPDQALVANFTHCGRSTLLDEKGQPHDFSHVPASAQYRRLSDGTVSGVGQIGDTLESNAASAGYVGVSPYGPWRVQMFTSDVSILHSITKIEVSFDVVARAAAARVS